ncbi:hypothetical protein IHE45_01G040500 [Dioscorea alata]|uniref:Uncharacterized protein n=1 Tax=Dioscorea alata TaxID=55571 RepID=A0ACB7WTD0_DIOAL|nr:hypothetical protein IHE45_01G040500 [Dioscorea alata]
MLLKFCMLCSGGYYGLGCHSNCPHDKQIDRSMQRNISNLPRILLAWEKGSLLIFHAVLILILTLGKLQFSNDVDLEVSYSALSSLEDVISILRRDASIDQLEVFNRVISYLVISLYSCKAALCDKVKHSADGAIQAVIEFITKRGSELNEADISRCVYTLNNSLVLICEVLWRDLDHAIARRTTQSLLSTAMHVQLPFSLNHNLDVFCLNKLLEIVFLCMCFMLVILFF